VIASQAMITGCFSLASQAISLGFAPPLKIKHTSKDIIGQIFLPEIGYLLLVLTIIAVAGFQNANNLTRAYGVTVCAVMMITTILYILAMRYTWHSAIWKIIPFSIFLGIEGVFMCSNLTKIPSGGYISLLYSGFFLIILVCWYFGQERVKRYLTEYTDTVEIKNVKDLIQSGNFTTTGSHKLFEPQSHEQIDISELNVGPKKEIKIQRIEGLVGIFLCHDKKKTPTVFTNTITKLHSLPEIVVFLTVESLSIPFVSDENRMKIKDYGNNIYRIVLKYGYAEGKAKVAADLLHLDHPEGPQLHIKDYEVVYFLNRMQVKVKSRNPFIQIFYGIYASLKSIYSGTPNNILLPLSNVVEVGIIVPIS